jgi:hypothetical protein
MTLEDWKCLPGVIVSYDAASENAVVRPLMTNIYTDSSTQELPDISDVPVISPKTAFASLKLPVAAGDKIMIVFCERNLDQVLHTDHSGLTVPPQKSPKDNRQNDYGFCVAMLGFHDFSGSAHGTDDSVQLMNNWKKGTQNLIRLEDNGDILVSNGTAEIIMEATGDIELDNGSSSLALGASGEIRMENQAASIEVSAAGDMVLTNNGAIVTIDAAGKITLTSSTKVDIVAPSVDIATLTLDVTGAVNITGAVNVTGVVTALDVITPIGTSLNLHTHLGNLGAPTSPPIP